MIPLGIILKSSSLCMFSEFVRHHPHLLNQDPELFSSIIKLSDDFGMSGLILSGGAMLGLHHFGLVETLIKSNLLPKIICGTSAGSAIAAFVCTRSDEEILRSIK